MMPSTRSLLLFLIAAVTLLLPAASDLPPAPPTPASPETQAELAAAFSRRLQEHPGANPLTFDLFTPELDTAFLTPDGKTAVLWLALRDDSGRLLATEPGLALARLSDQGWQVLLPGDPGWEETLAALPDGWLPAELSPAPKAVTSGENIPTAPLTGYFLPYAAGTSRWLEGSISHFQYIPELGYPSCSIDYCHYAYDFTDSWHFPLLASKTGTVFASRDSCSDGNPNCTNYMVLYNSSEGTYQIYLHMAYGTIPNQLTPGTAVKRGQYIGDSDDTGYSTSQHVHFMVTYSVWMGGDGYYWGQSVDIRFADVAINNGIPRTCYEVTHFSIYDGATECLGDKSDPRNPANDWFVSGNLGAYPPTGSLTQPAAGAVVASGNSPLIDVTAAVNDDVQVTAVRLLAKLSGQWVEIGPKVTQPIQPGIFDWDVNLCSVGPLNGPLEVALRVWDYEGNVALVLDPRTIQVDHACPPPTSQLNPAESFDSTAVRLSWDAASAGAGLSSFDLQWRQEPSSWNPANTISLPGDSRSTWFVGQPGNSYAFRLRALDVNNQPEPWPAGEAFETSVTLPAACTPDGFEPDDNPAQARTLPLGVSAQGNLCGAGDPDWFKVEIENPGDYFTVAPSEGGGAAVRITVVAGDGETVLTSGQAPDVGQGTILRFQAAAAGSYYLKVEPLTAFLMGTGAVYSLRVSETRLTFLPFLALNP
jgi:murein DD-endopeptidase MepM/ murein hydrolase activator NlpD